MIQFLLNRELRTEQSLDPNVTVLNYLREHLGKTGTKEGCASGDCGACTVVVGELTGPAGAERIRYRTLNSCLTFVSSLHGKQLITVEDLKHDAQLHQVQQAMVDCHGSQCGFCTPGFVMSLFALQKNAAGADKAQAHEALAGNLCRCTGYRPILEAAEQSCCAKRPDQFDAAEADTIARLKAIAPPPDGRAQQRRQALPAAPHRGRPGRPLRRHPGRPPARRRHRPGAGSHPVPPRAAGDDLRRHVEEMKQVVVTEDAIEIGAATALTDCHAALAADYPDFGELLQRFASLQIRNQGTLGGNIGNASPIGDSPPLLIALGAQIVLRQGKATRTLALEDYFIDYKVTARQEGEFIEKIIVPRPRGNQAFRAYKVSKRLDDDISAVCAAFNLVVEDGTVQSARIAFGGMAAIPKRAAACEQALLGAAWYPGVVEEACEALARDFTPLTDFRASREYRLLTAQNLLRKCFLELQAPAYETRVTAYV